MKNSKLMILLRGIIMENPVLILVLGTCPTLAVTTSLKSAFYMGNAPPDAPAPANRANAQTAVEAPDGAMNREPESRSTKRQSFLRNSVSASIPAI